MNFSEKVEKLREERRLSQSDLADLCGIDQARVSEWKKPGHRGPSLAVALRVARALGVPLEWLADPMAGADPPPPVVTESERIVLAAYRKTELPPDEAVRWLWLGKDAAGRPPSEVIPPNPPRKPGR